MGLVELKTKSAFDIVLRNGRDRLVVIDCYAKWCGPCKQLAPQLEKLAQMKPEVQFYKLDVDVNTEVAEDRQIESLPTILFYRNGKLLGDFCGGDFKGISETIEKLL